MQVDVASINMGYKLAVLTNDAVVPITNYFDFEGEECDEELAVTCVCGDDTNGWFAVDISQYITRPYH